MSGQGVLQAVVTHPGRGRVQQVFRFALRDARKWVDEAGVQIRQEVGHGKTGLQPLSDQGEGGLVLVIQGGTG